MVAGRAQRFALLHLHVLRQNRGQWGNIGSSVYLELAHNVNMKSIHPMRDSLPNSPFEKADTRR